MDLSKLIEKIKNLDISDAEKDGLKASIPQEYDFKKIKDSDMGLFVKLVYITAYKGPAGKTTQLPELNNKSKEDIAPGMTVFQLARICTICKTELRAKFGFDPIYPGAWRSKNQKN
jgi:hypothetical protein